MAVVEFAPYQKIPTEKKKADARSGTIDKDEDYLSFLESLNNKANVPGENGEPASLESLSTQLSYYYPFHLSYSHVNAQSQQPNHHLNQKLLRSSKRSKRKRRKRKKRRQRVLLRVRRCRLLLPSFLLPLVLLLGRRTRRRRV
jgi:regulator of nonsense transcripts 3